MSFLHRKRFSLMVHVKGIMCVRISKSSFDLFKTRLYPSRPSYSLCLIHLAHIVYVHLEEKSLARRMEAAIHGYILTLPPSLPLKSPDDVTSKNCPSIFLF